MKKIIILLTTLILSTALIFCGCSAIDDGEQLSDGQNAELTNDADETIAVNIFDEKFKGMGIYSLKNFPVKNESYLVAVSEFTMEQFFYLNDYTLNTNIDNVTLYDLAEYDTNIFMLTQMKSSSNLTGAEELIDYSTTDLEITPLRTINNSDYYYLEYNRYLTETPIIQLLWANAEYMFLLEMPKYVFDDYSKVEEVKDISDELILALTELYLEDCQIPNEN